MKARKGSPEFHEHNAEREQARTQHAAPYVIAFDDPDGPGRLLTGTSSFDEAATIARNVYRARIYKFTPKESRL